MPPTITPADLARFLFENPNVLAASIAERQNPSAVHVLVKRGTKALRPLRTQALGNLPLIIEEADEITDLRKRPPFFPPENLHQSCQNEPVQLGCQVQPLDADWVGTAGAPVHWTDAQGQLHWGILSNWHVMAPQPETRGHPLHQPDYLHPAIAALDDWSRPDPAAINKIDAALADALIQGFHTISRDILDIGPLDPRRLDARPPLHVKKSGRTTQLTFGHCTATGAAVRVSYGDFTAVFQDQDLFACDGCQFSAPGDSGSLIVSHPEARPLSLLFAGGGGITVGNPIRHVIANWPSLTFNL